MPKTAFQNIRTMTAALLLAAVTLFVVPVSAQKPVDGKKAKEASQKSSSASELANGNYRSPGNLHKVSVSGSPQTVQALKANGGRVIAEDYRKLCLS